jgi:hypothetical protein
MNFFKTPYGIALAFYVFSLLVQHGYATYYGLSVPMLSNSFFFDIFFLKLAFTHIFTVYIIKHQVITVVGFTFVSLLTTLSSKSMQYFFVCAGIILFFFASAVGGEIAKSNRMFYSFKKECSFFPSDKGIQYVAPIVDFERNRAVFIALDANNVSQKSFAVVSLTQSSCPLEIRSVNFLNSY